MSVYASLKREVCLLGVQAIGANSNSVFEDIADDMNNLRTGTVD